MHPDEDTQPTIDADLEKRFANHPAKGDQRERYEQLWAEAKQFAYTIKRLTPYSREQSLALTHLEDTVTSAIGAIARNE